MKYTTVKPFVKWAGGKSRLLSDIRSKYPTKITKYCEPFVGGGAVLLDILANFNPDKIMINDINAELVNTYVQIRDNVDTLIEQLQTMQDIFWSMNKDERKAYYYGKRERFNFLKKSNDNLIEKATLFILLNKTCFNGLYRVNCKGEYNVPMGEYKNPHICDSENLKLVSKLLQGVQIICDDYSATADFIDENTFVYIDPPYRPLTKTSSFTSYASTKFGDKEQIELSRFIDKITIKGAKVVASNSDPKNVDESDNFFDNLYRSYTIMRVSATRMINSKASGRGSVNELLICNY